MNQYPESQPNLSSILQTLSAYTPAPPPQQQQQQLQQPQYYYPTPPIHHPLPNQDQEEGEVAEEEEDYNPATTPFANQLSPPGPPHPNAPNLSNNTPGPSDPHILQPRAHQRPASSSSSKLPLPSTEHVTSYPLALRHITTHLLPHPHFVPRIQHLIHEQHKHEREWHGDRVKLQRQLDSREESRRKLDAVLASFAGASKPLGGAGEGGGGGGGRAELSEAQELALFDRKVWKAQKEMVGAAEKELGRLGVPFFGRDEWGGSREELGELRGKVLGLLNDLCGEDEGNKE